MLKYILLVVSICLFQSCKEDGGGGTNPEEAQITQGQLYSANWGTFRTRLASDDWATMTYGFDAIADQPDAYVSVEQNNKSNTFLLLSAPNIMSRFSVKAENNNVSLSRGSEFTIPDPGNPNSDISAVRYTMTSTSYSGSVELKVYYRVQSMQDGTYHDFDLETLEGEDVSFWGYDAQPGAFKNPITLDAKIYPQTILPIAYVYKLYGTTADITGVEAEINKTLAQAVCKIQAVTLADTWPYADKSWDLNNNGKLDLWPNDPGNSGDEFFEIKEWARDLKQIWSDTKIGVAILEQEFEVHDNSGVEIHGISEENFVVLPGNLINRNFCHEYLHCDLAKDLKDINDEFNVMHYTDLFEQNRLRYRPVTIVTGAGGNERQWDILTGVSY